MVCTRSMTKRSATAPAPSAACPPNAASSSPSPSLSATLPPLRASAPSYSGFKAKKAPIKAARARLYAVLAKCSTQLLVRNKEGLNFNLSVKDSFLVGAGANQEASASKLKEVLLTTHVPFYHVEFVKADGTIRGMYCMNVGNGQRDGAKSKVGDKSKVGANMVLHDLELENTELRQCVLDRLLSVTVDGTRYHVSEAHYHKLLAA